MNWGVSAGDKALPSTWGVDRGAGGGGAGGGGAGGGGAAGSVQIENLGEEVIHELQESVASFRRMPEFPPMDGISETLRNIGLALEERQVNYQPPPDSRECSLMTLNNEQLVAVEGKLVCAANALSSLDPTLLECVKRYSGAKNLYTVGKQIQCLASALPTITQQLQQRAAAAAGALESVEALLQSGSTCQCNPK